MNLIKAAQNLLEWNTVNLTSSSDLKKSEIGLHFADQFQVYANGRRYDATHDNYFEFLNHFRATIGSIRYELHEMVDGGESIAIPMTAHIARVNGKKEVFEAILILKFNQQGKIVLWHEVYISVG